MRPDDTGVESAWPSRIGQISPPSSRWLEFHIFACRTPAHAVFIQPYFVQILKLDTYSTPGRYPAAAEGVAEMTACFDHSTPGYPNHQCYKHAAVGVVRCDGFLLWRLPYAPSCNTGYCTAASGL